MGIGIPLIIMTSFTIISLITVLLTDIFRSKLEKKIEEEVLPTLIEIVVFSEVTVSMFFLLYITSYLFGEQITSFITSMETGISSYIGLATLMIATIIEFIVLLWLGKKIGEDIREYDLYNKEHGNESK
jgi:hypothetical protein